MRTKKRRNEQGTRGGGAPGRGFGGRGSQREVRPWWAPVLYGAATLLLFRKFVFTGDMLVGTDTLALGYMARDFYAHAVRDLGTFPLWNPLILGGTPFLESLAGGDSLYPTALLLFVMDTHRALGWKLVLHVFAAGLFTYGWLRTLGRSRPAALLSGLAYLLAPFLVTLVYPGHDGKIFVTALTPLLFWAAESTFRSPGLRPYAGVALVVGLVILTTHFQMAYFLFGAVGLYYLFRCVQEWRGEGGPARAGGRLGLFLAAALLGAGVSAVQLVPAVDYVTEHSRRTATTAPVAGETGLEWSSSWSLHPEEVVSLVVPEFVGNSAGGAAWASDTYWGRNPFKLNHESAGLVVLLLAGLAFFGGADRALRWAFAGLGLLALLFALGAHTPVWRLFYEVVPGIRLFRAPSSVAFLFGFSAVTLMAYGVDRGVELARGREGKGWKGASAWLWGAAGVLGLLALAAGSGALLDVWTAVVHPGAGERPDALEAARPFIVRGFLAATLLAAATAGVWTALRRGVIGVPAALAVLGLLVAVDQVRVDDPFIQTMDVRPFREPDGNMRFLMERLEGEPPFRVFSMLQQGQDVRPGMFGVELAAGHHPNDLARYRDLIGMVGSGMPQNLGHPNVLTVLNVRYILWPEYQGGLQALEKVSETMLPDGRPYTAVYAYPGLPRARLVSRAEVVPDEDAIAFILGSDFDPVSQVVLPEPPPIPLPGGEPQGRVRWEERGLNRMRLTVSTDRNALLVLADNWFPAWKARVDGNEAELLRANYALRAIAVPEGDHLVELRYDSPVLRAGLWASLASLVLVLGIATASWARRRGGRGPAAR